MDTTRTHIRSSRWLLPALAGVALLGAGGLFHACRRPPGLPPSVITAPVTVADIEDAVLAEGALEASKLVSVGAQASGQIRALRVKLGDRIHRGDPIAEIDALTQQNDLRDAQASLATTRAKRTAKEATLRQAELAFRRAERLLPSEAGSRADYESAQATLETTRAELAQLDAEIEQARIAVSTRQVNLGYTRITAPMDGVVVAVVAEEGQTVNAAQSTPTIVKIADLDTMKLKAEISEADVTRVRPGLPVRFSILGEPEVHRSTVLGSIEPGPTTYTTDSTSTSSSSSSSSTSSSSSAVYYYGLCRVPNGDGALRIAMTVQASIVVAHAEKALTVPSGALGPRRPDGTATVRVADGDRLVERTVRVGIDNHDRAQILEGLRAGERVVVSQAPAAPAADAHRPPPPGMF